MADPSRLHDLEAVIEARARAFVRARWGTPAKAQPGDPSTGPGMADKDARARARRWAALAKRGSALYDFNRHLCALQDCHGRNAGTVARD